MTNEHQHGGSIRGCVKFLQNILTNIWSLGKRADLKPGEVPFFINSQLLDFINWMVFELVLRDSTSQEFKMSIFQFFFSYLGLLMKRAIINDILRLTSNRENFWTKLRAGITNLTRLLFFFSKLQLPISNLFVSSLKLLKKRQCHR